MKREEKAILLDLPRPASRKRLPMPVEARAAQFASFAALGGYEEMIDEAARVTEDPVLLDEQEQERIAARLRAALERLTERPLVTAEVFEPDPRKSGGLYRTLRGRAVKWKEDPCRLILADGTEIPIARVTYFEFETEENEDEPGRIYGGS